MSTGRRTRSVVPSPYVTSISSGITIVPQLASTTVLPDLVLVTDSTA